MKKAGTKNLSYTQRLQLEAYLRAGLHKKEIAKLLGICLATVYNELKRGQYMHRTYKKTDWFGEKHYKDVVSYSPNIAQDKYLLNQTAKGRPLKVGNDFDFVKYVERRIIHDKISPCALVGEIRRKNICRTIISKTTMYRYIAQGLFMNISMEHLPIGIRKKQYRETVIKSAPRGASIEQRPADIYQRQIFGHWEMDCVLGKQEKSDVLLVLTERLSRYEIIMRMHDKRACSVIRCINKLERRFGKKFRSVFKSITVDNGSEFSDFNGLERSVYGGKRTSIYYCHPYSSCERGTNERINRDIRRWIPKGTDIKAVTDRQIQFVADWINSYPREIFGFSTAAERFAKEFAAL